MQPAWIVEAWREFGQKEIPGSAHNPRILEIFKDAGHPQTASDEVAWCAAFAGACLERAGVGSTRSLRARSYLDWGRSTDRGRLGVIAVFSRGSDPAAGHVGFWVGETDHQILVLGGNQANSVSVAWIDKSRLLGLRLPEKTSSNIVTPLFDTALAHVLEMEGGFSDDPYDPGGPTNRGITLATLAAHRGVELTDRNASQLKSQLKALSRAEAGRIYLARYWTPSMAEHLPRPVALMHFDAAVNHGVGTAARILQEAARVRVDGEIGPETRRAVWRAQPVLLIETYADLRRNRYRKLQHFWRFGRGWLARVENTLAAAQRLAHEAQPSSNLNTTNGKGDRTMPDTTTLPSGEAAAKWWGESLTIWGSIITGLSTVLPVVGPLFGLNITSDLVVTLGEDVVRVGQAVGGLTGTLMVILGRVRAETRLTTREIKVKV